jgi:hypothetical protein
LDVDAPVLPRVRRVPRRLDDGGAQHEDNSVEDFYRRLYFLSLDSAISCLLNRFRNPAFQLARTIESTLVAVVNTGEVPDLKPIITHYEGDIDESRLKLHLEMLSDICRSANHTISVSDINQVVQLFNTNEGWSLMLSEVINLLRLFLTLPVTSCTADSDGKYLKYK